MNDRAQARSVDRSLGPQRPETVDTLSRREDYGSLMSLPFAYSVRRWFGVLVAKCGQGVATRDR